MSTTYEDATSSKGSRRSGHCNNKIGKNQYKDRPAPDDPRVSELLREYHCKGITDGSQVSKLLLEEHGIILSETTIARRKRKLGLKASHFTTLELNVTVKRQLILDQMAKDPKGRLGARMVKRGILRDTGIHLTRDYIREEMKNLDPAGHAARGPAHIKAKRQQKQLATQDISISDSSEPSEGHSNLNLIHCSTQTVPPDIPSGSIPNLKFYPIPLSPVLHSTTMDVDEDSDSSSISRSSHAEIPDHLKVPPSCNPHPASKADLLPDTLPLGPSQAATSPSMTVALSILQVIAPQMGALTRMLDSLKYEEEVLDAQAHDMVTAGMEAAALLERQLARVASKARCSQS